MEPDSPSLLERMHISSEPDKKIASPSQAAPNLPIDQSANTYTDGEHGDDEPVVDCDPERIHEGGE